MIGNPTPIIDVPIIHGVRAIIPEQAGIQQEKNAFLLNPLDSRLRGNDAVFSSLDFISDRLVLIYGRHQYY
ncbi:MAG: hypothetical protein IPM27_07290 [Nitrosomonadales bacterium]|nr:hypothetical protein [Nitrosomonadales bacterium]